MIIIAHKYGQLGNRLCLFAHFIAIGQEHGITISDVAFDEYADFFQTTSADIAGRFPVHHFRPPAHQKCRRALHRLGLIASARIRGPLAWIAEKVILADGHAMDIGAPEFIAKARKKILFVEGWTFRSPANVAKHADAIRAYFRPIATLEAETERVLSEARKHADILIGVHVRHGDYRGFYDGRYFYTLEQYGAVMSRTQELFPGKRVAFILCSNESQDLAILSPLAVTPGPGNMVSDMYTLAGCDYILGAPSTFTTWASFYGDKPLYKIMDPDAPVSLSDFQIYLPD